MDLKKELILKIQEKGLFDEEYYVNQFKKFDYSSSPLEHYLKKGYLENKNPSEKFDANSYLSRYADVKYSGINPLIHYVLYGINENRIISPVCDLQSRLMSKKFFDEKVLSIDSNYYKNRWNYFSKVIKVIKNMEDINKILEIGPFKAPLVKNEDVLDITGEYKKYYPYPIGKLIKHDASKIPFPIKNKQYDLVIASQVLESLGIKNEQVKIFNEIERISKRFILTISYKWFIPNLRSHHMIDKRVIDYWASKRKPVYEKIFDSRILRVYEFD